MTTGAMAIMVASPTDLVKVRMQSEGKLPEGTPKRYPSATKAYGIIVRSASPQPQPGSPARSHRSHQLIMCHSSSHAITDPHLGREASLWASAPSNLPTRQL